MVHEKTLKARRRSGQAVKWVYTPNLVETRATRHQRQFAICGTPIPRSTLLMFLYPLLPCARMATSSGVGAGNPSPGTVSGMVNLDEIRCALRRSDLCGMLQGHLVCIAIKKRSANS